MVKAYSGEPESDLETNKIIGLAALHMIFVRSGVVIVNDVTLYIKFVMANFAADAFSWVGKKIKLHAASDYVGMTSSAVAQALFLSLREIVCNSGNPALQRLRARDRYYGNGLYFSVLYRGKFNGGGTGFYRYINRRKVTIKVRHNWAEPDTICSLIEAIHEGLGLRPLETTAGAFQDARLSIGYEELLGAFRTTDHEVFRRSFQDVERVLSASRDAARVAACWFSRTHFRDVLLASLARDECGTAAHIASEDLDKFMYHFWRLPLTAPRFLRLLTNEATDSAMQALANWDLPALTYIGSGAFSMAFNTHPDPEGRQQVVVLSPKGDEWPDTPYHAPAYAFAPLAGGGHIRVMPFLPSYHDKNISMHLSGRHLSNYDTVEKNIGKYTYSDANGKRRSVTLLRDWGAGPTNVKETRRDGLWRCPELQDRVAAQAHIALHGIYGATRYIAPSELFVPNAERVGFECRRAHTGRPAKHMAVGLT